MKKVLFVIPGFSHGGTNRSLWNLFRVNRDENLDVHIMSMTPGGAYKDMFAQFKLLPQSAPLAAMLSFRVAFSEAGVFGKLKLAFWKLMLKLFYRSESGVYRLVAKKLARCGYDVVVAAQEGKATELASFIYAKKRIAWVRCDYSNYLKIANKTDEYSVYQKFDNVICVSNYTADVFRRHYDNLSESTYAIHEPMDSEGILEASGEKLDDSSFDNRPFTLVSIGRLDAVKRFTYIPEMASKLKASGADFKWYIIGGGGTEEATVKSNIAKFSVEDRVVLLGERSNPYPYILASDVLVCPSVTEACPNVVNEAKILHIPVVAADFPTSFEYIENDVNGVIAPIEEIADVLIRLYSDRDYYEKIKRGISSFKYENSEIVEAVNRLIIGEK